MLNRFYPPSAFGAGKPQSHWLLDEAGAHLVAAMLGVERKQLGWQRRDDWGSHRQLAHRLEANRFVTDLVAATLTDRKLAVTRWAGPRAAAEHLEQRVRPDAGLLLQTATGAVLECLLEWDRATEPGERLAEKLARYRIAERKLRYRNRDPRSILFVVPGERRLETLRRLPARDGDEGYAAAGSWPIVATTVPALRRDGPLAPIWLRIDRPEERPRALSELPARSDLPAADRCARSAAAGATTSLASGSSSPLAAAADVDQAATAGVEEGSGTGPSPGRRQKAATEPAARQPLSLGLAEARRRLEEEMRQDLAAARAAGRLGITDEDLRSSAINGSMDDRDHDVEEEPWR